MEKGTLKIVKGDATKPQRMTDDEVVLIPHVCNNLGIMGGGVALGLKRKWPAIEKPYKEEGDLGECSIVEVDNYTAVANMVAQNGLVSETNPKPIRYSALVKCMIRVKNYALANGCVIHTPKFGSLRAGGNWNFIMELIREIWIDTGINVTIYEYKE